MKRLEPLSGITLHNILFATDFSPASEAAFPYAEMIAKRYDAKLCVAHVISLDVFELIAPESARTTLKQAHEHAARKIDELVGSKRLQTGRCQPIVEEGVVSEVLLNVIRRNHVDLAILGTHGRRALNKLLLGSIAEEVFRMAPCPVLTVGPRKAADNAKPELQQILYPLEFIPDSSQAAEYAISLADQYAANVTVMNVREDMPSSANKMEEVSERAESWIADHVPPASHLRNRIRFERGFGPAAEAILNFATTTAVDLIVMPVRRLDPIMSAHLPKPDTAYDVISRSPCPVLTIR